MGYLHDGHLSLVKKAKELCDSVVVSIFVNPTQFGPGEDFQRYPRDEEGDRAKLERESVDFLFIPEAKEIYPAGYQTYVEVTEVSKGLCGDFRPGHFRGLPRLFLSFLTSSNPTLLFSERRITSNSL